MNLFLYSTADMSIERGSQPNDILRKQAEQLLLADVWVPPSTDEKLAIIKFWGEMAPDLKRKNRTPLSLPDLTELTQKFAPSVELIESFWNTTGDRVWKEFHLTPFETVIHQRLITAFKMSKHSIYSMKNNLALGKGPNARHEQFFLRASAELIEGNHFEATGEEQKVLLQRMTLLLGNYNPLSFRYWIHVIRLDEQLRKQLMELMKTSPKPNETHSFSDLAQRIAMGLPKREYSSHEEAIPVLRSVQSTKKPDTNFQAEGESSIHSFVQTAFFKRLKERTLETVLQDWTFVEETYGRRQFAYNEAFLQYFFKDLVRSGVFSLYRIKGKEDVYIFIHDLEENG